MSYIAEYEQNKKVNYEKISMSLSILSFVVSIIAICLSIKAINSVMVSTIKYNDSFANKEKTINFVDKVPDVDIVRQDGSVISVKTYDSKDSVNKIIREEEKKQIKLKSNKISLNNNNRNNLSSSNKKNNVVKNNVKKTNVQNINVVKQEETDKTGIHGNYVIQVGSFYNPERAVNECDRVRKTMKEKKCDIKVVSANNVRTIVYPFDTKEEATQFSIKMNQMLKIQSFVKKNG